MNVPVEAPLDLVAPSFGDPVPELRQLVLIQFLFEEEQGVDVGVPAVADAVGDLVGPDLAEHPEPVLERQPRRAARDPLPRPLHRRQQLHQLIGGDVGQGQGDEDE